MATTRAQVAMMAVALLAAPSIMASVAAPAGAVTRSATGTTVSVTPPPAPDVFAVDTGHTQVVEVPAGGGAQTAVGSGLFFPSGVALDAAGNVFITDNGHDRIVEIAAGGGAQTTIASGLRNPQGLAVDAAGDVFVAETNNNRVIELPAGGAPQTTVGTGLSAPAGVAVDAAGDVLIADTYNNRVVEVPAGGGPQLEVGSGLNQPFDVAVDAAGNVFVADTGHARVVEVPAGGGAPTTIASGLRSPQGVAVDAAGDVFISDNDRVLKVPAGGGAQTTIASGLSSPDGLAVDVPAARVTVGQPVTLTATVQISPSGTAPSGSRPGGVVTFFQGSVTLGTTGLTSTPPYIATVTARALPAGTDRVAATFAGDANDAGSSSAPIRVLVARVTGTTVTVTPPPAPDVFVTQSFQSSVVKVPADGGAQSMVGSGFSSPFGVAVDAAGDLFVADTFNDRVVKVPAGGGGQTTVGSGLRAPQGVAVDATGNVFIADASNNRVVEVPADGSGQTVVASAQSPGGVAVDAAGDLFVADTGNNRVVELAAGSGALYPVGSGLRAPQGVAVDAAGDVFIADTNNSRVLEFSASTGVQTTVASAQFPQGVAVDAAGDVFIASAREVVKVPAGGGSPTPVGSGLSHPTGVAVDVPSVRSAFRAPLSLTATVQASPAGYEPTGTVTFTVGAATLGTATLSGTVPDTATLTTTALPAGIHHVTATYDGDTSSDPSPASAPITVDVTVPARALIIDQLRLSGPGGAGDQYVQLYNTTGSLLPLRNWALRYVDLTASPPTSIDIPLRYMTLSPNGSYLIAGPGYSLAGFAAPDQTLTAPLPPAGVAQLIAPDGALIDTVSPAVTTPAGSAQYAYVRHERAGQPVDTDNDTADFVLVGPASLPGAVRGSPDPAGTGAPVQANAGFPSRLLDPSKAATAAPNRVITTGPTTLTVRRAIVNATPSRTITAMRLRISAITTTGVPGTHAVLVPTTAPGAIVTVNGQPVTVTGLAPTIPPGGASGLDTVFDVPLPPAGLPFGSAVNVEVRFTVPTGGAYSFGYDVLVR